MTQAALVKAPQSINHNSIVGYAILAVNINSNNNTFVDYFVPMVSEILRVSTSEFVTIEEIHENLNNSFGINIPLHVIRTILNKLRRKRHIFYDSTTRSYKPNRETLELSNFKEKQVQTLESHHKLISELQDFLSEYSMVVSFEEAEQYFEEFISRTGYSIYYEDNLELSQNPTEKDKRIYLVASFIKKLEKKYSPAFKYYESIIVGNMLATAMYYAEPDKYQQKFNRTEVYLDAPFIIFALGYAGQLRADPCLELIKMLKSNHASLRCFQHSVDEIRDILNGCITKLERGINDNFGTIEYFLQKQYDKADILRLIYSLENDITTRLRVKIVENPDFTETLFNIDEKDYTDFLKENVGYKHDSSLDRDVKSVHSIERLRKGHKSHSVETSRALFITNNERLSRQTKRYFRDTYNGVYIPPILTDYELTTILWVKNPQVNPSLPRKRIIADCIASMQPPERIISKFLGMINQLYEAGELSEGDYSILKVSQESRHILMDETQGDEDVLTNAKIYEIIDLTKKRLVEEKEMVIESKDHQLNEKEREIAEYKEKFNQKVEEDKKKAERQYKKSEKLSHIIHIVLGVILSITFCSGQFVVLKINDFSIPEWGQILLYAFFAFLFPFMSFWGVGFLGPLKASKIKLARFINNYFYS